MHIPVLLNEVIEFMQVKRDGVYLDGTFGGGGHSSAILRAADNVKLYCVDQDKAAINRASDTLCDFPNQFVAIHNNFSEAKNIFEPQEIFFDGVVLDLGVSSFQIDEAARGFSYMHDAPLDMRMNDEAELSAYDVVNKYSERDLHEIIRNYGEERFFRRIVHAIISNRPIDSTLQLADVIKRSIPAKFRYKSHPAKKTFQAIRIAVNDELNILEQSIIDIANLLKPNGILCVISFHSLEDRIVKHTFKKLAACEDSCNDEQKYNIITKKPVCPSEAELQINSRAHSAKLRVLKKKE